MNFNIKLSDTEITSLVNFIEHWNDVEQADQDLLDNVARKLDQTIINHREKVIKAQSKSCLLYTSDAADDSFV